MRRRELLDGRSGERRDDPSVGHAHGLAKGTQGLVFVEIFRLLVVVLGAVAGMQLGEHVHRTGWAPLTGVFLGVAVALILGVAALEGGQGAIEVMSLVSHILSYTRLVGILLASVILAVVINKIALGLFHNGFLAIVGVVILVIGQGFNIVLGVFEPGIQGARLVYVEYFSKFYHGGGRIFRPFGAPRRYTEPQFAPPSSPPAGQVPGP